MQITHGIFVPLLWFTGFLKVSFNLMTIVAALALTVAIKLLINRLSMKPWDFSNYNLWILGLCPILLATLSVEKLGLTSADKNVSHCPWYLAGMCSLSISLCFLGEKGINEEQYWRWQRTLDNAGVTWSSAWWRYQERVRPSPKVWN